MSMQPIVFQNLVVLITGASSGIGQAAAVAFAQQGARLVLVARDEARLEEVARQCEVLGAARHPSSRLKSAKEIPPHPDPVSHLRVSPLMIPGDVANPDTLHTAVSRAVDQWGRLDILVNNAGLGHNLLLDEIPWEQITRIFDTNVYGTLHGVRAALPQMKQQTPVDIGGRLLRGQILNVSSVIAFQGIPQMSVYCATKAAVRSLTESLRLELRPHAIEVIGIYPGSTRTDFFRRAYSDGRPWLIEHRHDASAESVAHAILNACRRHRRDVVLTPEGKLLAVGSRYFPRLTEWGADLVFKSYRKRRAET